jgi:hypothetical protein
MGESEWARSMAQEFKAGKARKAEEDGKVLQEHTIRKESASKLRTDVREAFKHRAQMFKAAGEEILTWGARAANTFGPGGKEMERCVKGSYQEAGYEINVEVLARVVSFQAAVVL